MVLQFIDEYIILLKEIWFLYLGYVEGKFLGQIGQQSVILLDWWLIKTFFKNLLFYNYD